MQKNAPGGAGGKGRTAVTPRLSSRPEVPLSLHITMVKSLLASMITAGLFLLACSSISDAFYLPGVAPTDYSDNDPVLVHVNSLTPTVSQHLKSIIQYDYYNKQFHFCAPANLQAQGESLGSILSGDRLFNSPYELYMKKNETCKTLCMNQEIPKEDAIFINERIKENYAIRLMADGLPAGRKKQDEKLKEIFYSIGFELGEIIDGKSYLNNHYWIQMQYHSEPGGTSRVVGVLVWSRSRQHTVDAAGAVLCGATDPKLHLDQTKDKTTVHFTYDVTWLEDANTAWATRWDHYLHAFDPSIHWFSLVNSVIIVFFLTGMVAMILLRALHKDISRYNHVEAQEDAQEDSGWKLVHGDVFRPPARSMLLSIFVGSGAQLLAMTSVTLIFAVLGFLSPSNRGSLVTVMIFFYLVFGCMAGFLSARLYKMFGGECWRKNVVFTSILFPLIIFGMLLILNFFLISAQSSAAVPVGTLFAIVALWIVIGAPLSFVGSYFGFKKPRIEHPVRTNQIPRQIPEQIFYLRPIPSMLMGGVLPFGAIFIELYFIMNSVWGNRVYYLFGFTSMVFMILIATCSEVTILMCYFHLCSEDYHWWWRSFATSGASALYVFLYGYFYYVTKLEIDNFVSTVLYFGYTAIISVVFFALTGTIGFTACFLFVRKIYGSIKID